jgi:glucose uptake protein GlcU
MGLFASLNIDPSAWTMNDIGGLIHNATGMALSIAGVVAAIYIVLGAFQYFTAYGDEAKAEAGKKTLTWAIIGLVFVIVGQVVLGEIWQFLSGRPLP